MQLTSTSTFPASTPPLGTWVVRPELTGTRTAHRDWNGHEIDTIVGFDEFAARVVQAFDRHGDGSINRAEVRRTQQHLFGSNRDGSTDPALFVWPNTTVRQEVVSIAPLFAAAKGVDELLTVEELRAFVTSFDANGNGFLDTRHHGDRTGRELEAFREVAQPVVLGARQLTVEGKLEGVGHTIWDRWADSVGELSPGAASAPR